MPDALMCQRSKPICSYFSRFQEVLAVAQFKSSTEFELNRMFSLRLMSLNDQILTFLTWTMMFFLAVSPMELIGLR